MHMITRFKSFLTRYHRQLVVAVALFWLSLFTPIWQVFGHRQADINVFLLLRLFPVLGVLFVLLAIWCRKILPALFGLCLIAAFPITMALGYLFLGP